MTDQVETKPDMYENRDVENPLKHPEVFELIQSKVGLKEDAEYQRLYKPTDKLGESESLSYLAVRNFKRMAATVYHLIATENKKYDVIIGAGDSGIAMAKLMEMVYQQANIPTPKVVNLPVVRYKYTKVPHPDGQYDRFDNSILLSDAKAQIQDLERLDNILFVDDEIKNAIPSSESVKLVLSAIEPSKKASHPRVTVIAEDHGFKPEQFLDGTTAELYSFAEQIPKMLGVVGYIIPETIERQIKEHIDSKEMTVKNRLNALLNLPSREKYEIDGLWLDKPIFSNEKTDRAKREIPNFAELQDEFRRLVSNWINEAIEEYKQNNT